MTPEEKLQFEQMSKDIVTLKNQAIQLNFDPNTAIYLKNEIRKVTDLLPTSTVSASGPTGTATQGSVWYVNTGVLASNAIYVYNSGSWVQII